MPLIVMLIVSIACFVLSGMWLGGILIDKANERPVKFNQYMWTIGCFLFGLYAIIACIGHVAGVK